MFSFARKIPSWGWQLIANLLFLFGYMYIDEIKSFFAYITANPLPSFDWVKAIFGAGVIVGSIAFAWSGLSSLRKKRASPLTNIVPRRELPPLEDFISKAKSDVIFLGLTLEVVRQHIDTILQVYRKSITMTFMVFNPDSQLLGTMKDAFAPKPSEAIRTTLGTLIEMKNRLSDVEKQRFEIRICDLVPTNGMICIDAGTEDAMIQVEQSLYNTEPRSRPCVIVTKRELRTLYYTYWNYYLFMKSKSKVIA